ncbi:MAG TPA: T9SS type A sorting domain-containing protein [Ignavibacteriaceae bacterium]|nr:T9SS type A sorting domain-containing protein [Ignavibacteriaceae bacterium]
MKTFLLALIVFCGIQLTFSQQFHTLDGIEDNQGHTLLHYRLGNESFEYNPVFRYNTFTQVQNYLIYAHNIDPMGNAKGVNDFEFFPGDTSNFINVGSIIYPDSHGYISRNDSQVTGTMVAYDKVDISKQNPNKVFVFGPGGHIRSWDGGYTFPLDSIPAIANFIPISLADFDDNVEFGFNENNQLGKNGVRVDTSMIYMDKYLNFKYDMNGNYVYRVNKSSEGYELSVSNDKGNSFTWSAKFISERPIIISINKTNSGELYLSSGNYIYKSTDYGNNFLIYKTLPSRIVGLYKKPSSQIIYAATSYKLYEITPDTNKILISLPLYADLLAYYPLIIGNTWIYNWSDWWDGGYEQNIYTRTVISKEVLSNNKEYYKIEEKFVTSLGVSNFYERIDSITGLIYRFDTTGCENDERIIEDLAAVEGDSLPIQRFTYCGNPNSYFFSEEKSEIIFGDTTTSRTFEDFWTDEAYSYKLAKHFGLINIVHGYYGGRITFTILGCVINGVVYGDTATTDVKLENNLTPTAYNLSQNYPNPFNPSTAIKFQIPKASQVKLEVYDVLGNLIQTIVDEYKSAGNYQTELNLSNLSSGVYLYKLQAGDFSSTKKMMLVK